MRNILLIVFVTGVLSNLNAQERSNPPNIILILCDDLGFGDLSGYGSVWNQTPEIDRMAVEGVRFTHFYAGAPVCSPSRAALMTGSYARRVDLDLDDQNRWVLFPKASKGINPAEEILPEILKEAGYATAIIGKWHLGDQPEFLPMNHGFDYWYGMPYSNDMGIRVNDELLLPLMKNEEVVEKIKGGAKNREHQATLTQKYTEASLKWIDEHKDSPFFLYLSHTMPHVPVAARELFHSQTNHPDTAYGASVAEISWSTGEILAFLKEQRLADNTLVVFTSDNGGARKFGASNGILRGSKGQTFEGGIRVPFIAWWPGNIVPGETCHAMASFLDLLPTFSSIAGIKLHSSPKLDGLDISDYLFNPGVPRSDRPFYYWHAGYLMGVRLGDWKLNMLGTFTAKQKDDIRKSTYNLTEFPEGIELINLRKDPGETTDVSTDFPEVVEALSNLVNTQINALGQYTQYGPEVRKTLVVDQPVFLIE